MSKSTISTSQLFEMFPNTKSARVYIEKRRWPEDVVCHTYKDGSRITVRKSGYYPCNVCRVILRCGREPFLSARLFRSTGVIVN